MKLHGKDGQVLMDAIGGSPGGSPFAPIALASLSDWSLDRKRDRVPVTTFNDPNKTYVQGLADISGTLAGFLDTDDLAFLDAIEGEDAVYLRLKPSTNFSQLFWNGSAFVDGGVKVSVNGAIAISGSFVAAGAWSREG